MYLQSHIYKNIPVSFDFINTWNQGVFLCSPCMLLAYQAWLCGHKSLAILEETGQRQDSDLEKYTVPCNKTVLFYLTQPLSRLSGQN